MNPSTGTFISMDPAQGSIFDPVSLHKYLYANANPVMNCDPSGRFTMLEMGLTMAISGVITGFVNLLYYDSHGGDQGATSTRLGIFFGGFFQGALMSGGLLGLALIGTVLASALLGVILTGLGIKGISDAADRFQAGDNVWGWIFLASSFLCFIGALSSFRQAIAINDINTYNDMLANANAQSGSGLPGESGSKGKTPGPTIDPNTGSEVGRFINDGKGNTMIEPVGGKTVPAGKGGIDTHTTYPNGSNYQRLNPQGHANNSTPHGHGHLEGIGPGMKGQGPSIDVNGNIVPWNSANAHWALNI